MFEYRELRDLADVCLAHFSQLPPAVKDAAKIIKIIDDDWKVMMEEVKTLDHDNEVESWQGPVEARLQRLRKNKFRRTEHPPLKRVNINKSPPSSDQSSDPYWVVIEDKDGQG